VPWHDKEQLKPDDFPLHTEQKKIVKPDGKDIAEASTPKSRTKLRSG
jgi:hypothetical protein